MLRKNTRRARWATLALTVMLLFAWVVPAQALVPIIPPIIILPPIFQLHIQGISGTVVDVGTAVPLKGIVVYAYDANDGSYVWSGVTNSTGAFTLWLAPGSYKLRFVDAAKQYAETWYLDAANFNDGGTRVVTQDLISPLPSTVQLRQAAKLKTVVRRQGHPYTRMPGKAVLVQQKSAGGEVQAFTGTTASSGYTYFSGLKPNNVTYKESAIDPSGMFYSADATGTWLPIPGAATTTVYIDLPLANSSYNATITVPSSKSSVKRNTTFSVAVTASRNITTTQKIEILAKKGSTTKTFYLPKVSHPTGSTTKYLKGIKLSSKGTWKLYAVWPGSSKYATTDSINGKTVTVK